jgi:hypothetical protein
VVFTPEAAALVRTGLNLPDPEDLLRLEQRRRNDEPIDGTPSRGLRIRGGDGLQPVELPRP